MASKTKCVVWVGTTRKVVRAFPDDARSRAGYEVFRLQSGLDPTDWKTMSGVGDGVKEIRIRTNGEHRLIYVAKSPEALYVLHAFEKKTQKTPRADIALARHRYGEILAQRNRVNLSTRDR